MLARFKRGSGNRYTLVSIVMIIMMLYFFKFALRGTDVEYPQTVYFADHNYIYSQTLKASSFKFVRDYGKSNNGYIVLKLRSEQGMEVPERVYIFEGWKSYREYVLQE